MSYKSEFMPLPIFYPSNMKNASFSYISKKSSMRYSFTKIIRYKKQKFARNQNLLNLDHSCHSLSTENLLTSKLTTPTLSLASLTFQTRFIYSLYAQVLMS